MNKSIQTPRQRFLEEPIRKSNANPLVTFETGIPMRDGVELAADVYLPANQFLPAPGEID